MRVPRLAATEVARRDGPIATRHVLITCRPWCGALHDRGPSRESSERSRRGHGGTPDEAVSAESAPRTKLSCSRVQQALRPKLPFREYSRPRGWRLARRAPSERPSRVQQAPRPKLPVRGYAPPARLAPRQARTIRSLL